METLGALPDSGTALLAQESLLGSMWDSLGSLEKSTGLLGVRSPVPAGGGAESLNALLSSEISPIPLDMGLLNGEGSTGSNSVVMGTNPDASATLALSSEPAADSLTGITAEAALASVKINFQPESVPVPTGYTKDSGAAYSATRGYGWVREDSLSSGSPVPLDISPNARDRNQSGVEQRLDTLLHMQGNNITNFTGVKIPAAWEYALPNGTYSVAVSVGDQASDSKHRIRVEGVEAIRPFTGNTIHKYELGTAIVNVSDGKLTVDAIGGTNTKINYIEIASVAAGLHPKITGSSPASRQAGVNRNAAVSVDVALSTVGEGVDPATLSTTNVRLYRTRDNQLISGNLNTTGGGDAIVYQPSSPLEANTHYTFRVNSGVTDEIGASFLPFSTTFATGDSLTPTTPGVNFTKEVVYTGAPVSSLVISPNKGKLYAAGLDGTLRRWNIAADGKLTGEQVFDDAKGKLQGRAIIGLAFNPQIADDLYLWTTNNDPVPSSGQVANDFSGTLSRLSLNGGETKFAGELQNFIVGLPRSAKDHLSNSLVYGPDNRLYMTQGSNTAMGAPDKAWGNRPERLLSASVLRVDQFQFQDIIKQYPNGLNVQTENYVLETGPNKGQATTGNYSPSDPKWGGAPPVSVYASGIRNAYDLVWHSNGKLYVPTNGSAAGGNTPDDPRTTANEGLQNVATQNDYLFKVEKGGYYGHPNPKRQEYILNGGNPTSAVDPAEVIAKDGYAGYSVGTLPDPNYRGFTHNFGRNRSPNGVIEYKTNTFGGALKNRLLVVEYSGGDDILALTLDANGNVTQATQAASGLADPLDLIEDTQKNPGNLYVAELPNNGVSGGQITLLRPA